MKAKKNSGGFRVLRGGGFNRDSRILRVTSRRRRLPEDRYWYYGFRVVIRKQT